MNSILSTLQTLGLIVLVILFFNIMIFVHELGHFLAGKWRGAYIDRFQIWFGKAIWKKKIGGVTWGLGWIPAGGFVSLPQLEDMQAVEGKADVPGDLKPLKAIDKIIIAAAGPLFSLLLAYAFAVLVWLAGKPVAEIPGSRIGFVMPHSPAAEAGILPGDEIRAVDGQAVSKWAGNMEGVRELIAMSEHEQIRLSIRRPQADGSEQDLELNCRYKLPPSKWWQRGGLRRIGIMPAFQARIDKVLPHSPAEKAGLQPGDIIESVDGQKIYTPYVLSLHGNESMQLGVLAPDGSRRELNVQASIPTNWQGKPKAKACIGVLWAASEGTAGLEHPTPQQQVNQSLKWMGDTMAKVFAPQSSIGIEHLSGPVGIGSYIYKLLGEEQGLLMILWFAVVLNVNLAVLNILPLPIVDGGHVTLGLLELIRRKPVSGRILNSIQLGFFLLLISFFLFITFKDVGDMLGGEEQKQLPPPVFQE